METQDAISIIGAGPAGCTLALLLSQQGWKVLLYESETWEVKPSATPRTLALTQSSLNTLSRAGLNLQPLPHNPIRTIHVSQRGLPGQVVLRAEDEGLEAYGATLAYDVLLRELRQQIASQTLIEVYPNSAVSRVTGASLSARLEFNNLNLDEHSLLSPLVVIAEGGKSLHDPRTIRWSYGTSALSCKVVSDKAHEGMAWERFTPQGPIALLPTQEGLALIWTGPNARIDELLALDDTQFLAALQEAFGERAGHFLSSTTRLRYPLNAGFSLNTVAPRLVRIANAAQTLHPVAGQGFNLGLRDVEALVATLGAYVGQDPGDRATLQTYQKKRGRDRLVTGAVTHLLASGFTLPLPGLRQSTSLLFLMLDLSPGLKRRFASLMSDGVAA